MTKFDLENSPWTVVLVVALGCLVLMTLAVVLVVAAGGGVDTTPLLAAMGVWSTLVGTALTAGAMRARRHDGTDGDDAGS